MPTRALQPCSASGCPALVNYGRCAVHQRSDERQRGSASTRGYDAAWRRLRLIKLARNPMCEIRTHCADLSITKQVATEVHHVKPISERPDLRLEWSNLKSICKPCHSAITMREMQ